MALASRRSSTCSWRSRGSEAAGAEEVVVVAATPILDMHNITERDHESEENCRGEGDHRTPPKERVMDDQSSTRLCIAQGAFQDGVITRLTPKQEEAVLSLSRTCSSGIPTYICTMKKSNVGKRQLAFSRVQ